MEVNEFLLNKGLKINISNFYIKQYILYLENFYIYKILLISLNNSLLNSNKAY